MKCRNQYMVAVDCGSQRDTYRASVLYNREERLVIQLGLGYSEELKRLHRVPA
jgi:hypothetical protein